jgi:aminoglycoside phosphotransferase family enzyme/predicted kinase
VAAALAALPHALLDADAWAPWTERVELRETHISWVFLAGDTVLKVKKPVALPFVDYSTLERRRRFCHEEVRLNRRLAPRLYRGVRALVPGAGGGLRLAGESDPAAVEYAVEMRRFDEQATLAAQLERDEAAPGTLVEVGARIARFHAEVPAAPDGGATARFEALLAETLESLRDLGAGDRLTGPARFCGAALAGGRGELDGREADGRVRDGHGDLRAEHVLLERGIEVIDCVEFDPVMRAMDVGADLAFLVMDAARHDVSAAAALLRAYREAGGDPGDERLVCLFAAYRALVRAKVERVRADQLTGPAREDHEGAAREHLALADRWAWRGRLRGTIIVAGLSGSGKSTLARALAEASGREVLAADLVRKAHLGLPPTRRAGSAAYTREVSREVYGELGRRAAVVAARDGGVLVDATCRRREDRDALRAHADGLFVECVSPVEVLRARVRARAADPDRVSDADEAVLRAQLDELEAPDELPPARRLVLDTTRPVPELLDALATELDARLADGPRP